MPPPSELVLAETRELGAAPADPASPPTPRRRPRRLGQRWPALASGGALVAAWWALSATGLVPALFLPSPARVLERLAEIATSGFMDATLWQHATASLARVAAALAAALLTALPLGVLIGRNRTARAALDPLIEFYRPVPPLAYLPLIVIWFGIGELSKVLLIYLAIFAPLVIATAGGVARVDASRVQAARSLGASRAQVLCHVVLPSALPDILTGTRIALGVGWSTLVAAELIAATRGLGFIVQSASQFLVTDVVIAGILAIALIALAFELALRALERRFAGWNRPNP